MSLSTRVHEESFANIALYHHNLQRTNMRIVTDIKKDMNNRFEFSLLLSDSGEKHTYATLVCLQLQFD